MATFLKTADAFVPGSHALAREYLVSSEIFAREEERIFRRTWFCVGRADELPDAGCYKVIEFAGESVIILRDRADVLRGFYNTCRHRGARLLCEQNEGQLSASIQCPYHAWTYALDGQLIGAPHMKDVPDFDRTRYPLHYVEVDTWEGLVFANLERDPQPLLESLGTLVGRFSRFNIPLLKRAKRIAYDVRANWKIVFQNYNECLHCPVIHPELNGRTPFDSGANDLVDGPFLGGSMDLGAGFTSMTLSGNLCALPVGDLPAEDHGRVYYYSILPNLLLSMHHEYVMLHTLWPKSPALTHIVCEWLFHADAFSAPGFNPDDATEFWHRTNLQDWRICELTQRGVSSRAYVPGPYSPRESIPAAWDREYLRRITSCREKP